MSRKQMRLYSWRTRRDKIAFSRYHCRHDRYLAANLGQGDRLDGHFLPGLDPAGVPRGLAGTALPFRYNRLEDLEGIVGNHRGELAAIVMKPVREPDPEPGFLEQVREIATETRAVLIFGEVTSGMRMNPGGIHLQYGVTPDVAVFAKANSNGYPMAAVIGVASVMEAAQESFISSSYWTERIGPAAALATIRKHRDLNVAARLIDLGKKIQTGWRIAAQRTGLKVHAGGIPPLSHISLEYDEAQAVATLFTELRLERGFLAGKAFYASYAHQDEHVESYLSSVTEVFSDPVRAIESGDHRGRLRVASRIVASVD
jgi:glutamate-1-semialdehyde 2,1-aminomutase